jgi:hypothetical protein
MVHMLSVKNIWCTNSRMRAVIAREASLCALEAADQFHAGMDCSEFTARSAVLKLGSQTLKQQMPQIFVCIIVTSSTIHLFEQRRIGSSLSSVLDIPLSGQSPVRHSRHFIKYPA